MSDTQKDKQPAVLLYGSDDVAACRAIASGLVSAGFSVVVACPAGSSAEDAREPGCVYVNADKGNALRAGLQYFNANMSELPGVVTVDVRDGYSSEDIVRAAEAMAANPVKLAVASRRDNPAAGLFPRLQRLTAWLAFACIHGRSVKDPWAGLRAIPSSIVPALLDVGGEGGRYAFNIVLNLQHKGIKVVSVPVSAQYTLSDESGFRRRAGDIFRILILPFKFISASLIATLADYAVFLLLDTVLLPGHWAVSMTTSRGTGAAVGYFLNRNLVFRQKNNTWRKELLAALQFALLALFNYGASLLIVYILHDFLHVHEIIARFISDALLFVSSYTIQRELIFCKKSPAA